MFINLLAFALVILTHQTSLAPATKAAPMAPTEYYKALLKARADMGKSDFKTAAVEFATLAANNPAAGEAWLSLGNCYYEMKEPGKAIEPYRRALVLGHGSPENNAYNIGCCYALSGDKENAIAWVEKALAMRFENRRLLQTDTDLTSLHDDPRWAKLAGLPPNKDASRDEQWTYDIDFLVGEMKRMHYRWSREGLPKQVIDSANALKSKVGTLSDGEILLQMQKMLVMLEDGHSKLVPIYAKAPLHRIHVRFYKFSEGLFVIDGENTDLLGSQVLAIGGKGVEELWAKLADYVSRDNEQGITWVGPFYLQFSEILKDAGANVSGNDVVLTLRKRDGSQLDVTVEAKPFTDGHDQFMKSFGDPSAAPLYLKKPSEPYYFESLPDAKTVYLQYNSVRNNRTEPLSAFAVRLRKHLDENPVENLVIDVRHNGGGNSFLNRELIRTFVSFETEKNGRIFLITGRNTFSAAQNFTNDVIRITNALVIGEPSSSRPFFIGESAGFTLPYSKVTGTISTRLHTVNAFDQRVWIAPDIPVPVTAADYFANKDAALGAILDVIKSSPGQ
jgi:tetratricopeptide (TPR) repeat protein